MRVYKLARAKFAVGLSASGISNRWNFDREFVIYAGSSRSLATLELVVHRNAVQLADAYKMMVIDVSPDKRVITEIKSADLPSNWRTVDAYSALQAIGSKWYQQNKSLLLKVPTAIIVEEHNYLINTNHPDFKACVNLVGTEDYFWDQRLL